jgi:Cdc6-like AAA superfamily ATPase
MAGNEYVQLAFDVGAVFTPASPINERGLLAGRVDQVRKILNAISQRGHHVVLYGQRGVGKTSLANVLSDFLRDTGRPFLLSRVNCDGSDTFPSLWRKLFRNLVATKSRPGMQSPIDSLPAEISPEDVQRTLANLARGLALVAIFDEFDRIADDTVTTRMADTMKALSDYAVPATILLIGVADSVDQLIRKHHHSVERSLVQIPMPRMSNDEIALVVRNGLAKLTMDIDDDTRDQIVRLSQGLPYITHMLSLYGARAALQDRMKRVTRDHLQTGIRQALDEWQQSAKSALYAATASQQPGTIYKEVLLACAFAEIDELGYFTAAAVRTPLKLITGKNYDIPNFAKHLKELSEPRRGTILQRVGENRRLRHRFVSPLMRPYITMRHFADGSPAKEPMDRITAA